MYYELVIIKEYYQKTSKGAKTPYYQIRLKKDSHFNKPYEVALIDVSEIKEIEKKLNEFENNEYLNKYNDLKKDYDNLIKELNEIKEENKLLESEINENKNTILNLQDSLLTKDTNNKDNKEIIESLNNEISNLKDTLINEKTKLEDEKDLTKALLKAINDINNRNVLNRLINTMPHSYNKLNNIMQLKEPLIIENENKE